MESTPAIEAQRIPCAPWACAATLRPRRWASATMARISSRVYWEACGSSPLESTPPVAQILMRSAPYLMFCLTMCCTAAMPSATPSAATVVLDRQQVLIAVATSDAQRRSAHQHVRAGNLSGVDGVAQVHIGKAAGAYVAHGSD